MREIRISIYQPCVRQSVRLCNPKAFAPCQVHFSFNYTFRYSKSITCITGERFRVIGNSLPHHYIFHSRATIPISLVHVFVAIARRLGLPVTHANVPNRVLAWIKSSIPTTEDFFVDVYDSTILTKADMNTFCSHLRITFDEFRANVLGASGFTMLTRAMRNIMSCNPLDGAVSDRTAMYCAQFPVILARPEASIHVLSSIDDPALEVSAFLLPTVMPLLEPEQREAFHRVCDAVLREDQATSSVIKRRSELNTLVEYRIGLFFTHLKYGYTGLIYGWDVRALRRCILLMLTYSLF